MDRPFPFSSARPAPPPGPTRLPPLPPGPLRAARPTPHARVPTPARTRKDASAAPPFHFLPRAHAPRPGAAAAAFFFLQTGPYPRPRHVAGEPELTLALTSLGPYPSSRAPTCSSRAPPFLPLYSCPAPSAPTISARGSFLSCPLHKPT